MTARPQATPAHTPALGARPNATIALLEEVAQSDAYDLSQSVNVLLVWLREVEAERDGLRFNLDALAATVKDAGGVTEAYAALLAALEEMVVCLEDEPSDATARLPMLRAAIAAACGGAR